MLREVGHGIFQVNEHSNSRAQLAFSMHILVGRCKDLNLIF